MVQALGGQEGFDKFKSSYDNDAIAVLVKNQEEALRIIESKGRLIQKIYPIYKEPDPNHVIDFDAQFYLPAKHFMRTSIDTVYFNLAVIWAMSILMYFTLYYDLLRKLINLFEG